MAELFAALMAVFLVIVVCAFVLAFIGAIVLGVSALLSLVWNVAMPPIFGLPEIDVLQALCLLIVISLLTAFWRRE